MGRVAVTTAPPGSSTVTAVTMLEGKVASVNQNLHFVVLDYSFHSLPPLDRRLSVYRQGQKVGEVKVTGPQRAGNIAADILIGEAKEGDEVREN